MTATSTSSRLPRLALCAALAAALACSGGTSRQGAPTSAGGGPGTDGSPDVAPGPARTPARAFLSAGPPPWYVHVERSAGGTITSSDGLVACGAGGGACGDVQGWTQYPASTASVTLTATADAARGFTFLQWAGACSGSSPTCTVAGGANRWVGAVFRSATHASGPSRVGSVYGVQVNNSGGGTVYSDDGWIVCRSGSQSAYYGWSTVAVLHAVPDPGYQLASWAGDCGTDGGCQLSTTPYGADKYVVPVFDALPNVAHPNWSTQALHGPAYLDFLGGRPGARQCTGCHGGTALGGQGIAPSCHTCHAQAGWAGWQTNCSFCHGDRGALAKAGYAVSAHPTWSAPPDAVAQRLDPGHATVPSRTGAHQAHLAGVTAGGLTFAQPFACATCHAVPADLTHVDGSFARAEVMLSGAGQASLPAALGTYDAAAGTCTTACHGASPSPAWSSTGLRCGACHGLPPAASTGHPAVSSDLTRCGGCHPDTVSADGTIDVAGGKHVNGAIEASGGHDDYSAPATHGPRFFDALRADGASGCKGCHGATFDGGMGPSCNACHAAAGWTASWQTNCSFCHGLRSSRTMTAAYDPAVLPTLSAPPDALSQRLTGTPAPDRTGAHGAHLAGRGTDGVALAPALACASCHAVPTDLAHAGGSGAATVTLAGRGNLPASLGTYAPATGTCATYCHGMYAGTYAWETYDWGSDSYVSRTFRFQGSGAGATWSGGAMTCASCHGNPPRNGGVWHSGSHGNAASYNDCQVCHPDATGVNGVGQVITNLALHLDGLVQVTPRWSTRCFGCH
jgi:hypothetical protein